VTTPFPKDDSIWARMYHPFMFDREAFMDHYHKRPNADSVRSKCDVGQINEVLAKVLCHNMCVRITATHELGVEATFGVGSGLNQNCSFR